MYAVRILYVKYITFDKQKAYLHPITIGLIKEMMNSSQIIYLRENHLIKLYGYKDSNANLHIEGVKEFFSFEETVFVELM